MDPEPYEHRDDLICDPACPASGHHYEPGSGCYGDLAAEDFEDDPRIYTTPFNGIPVVNDIEETPPCCHTPQLCGGPHADCYSALQYDPERAQNIAALRFNLARRAYRDVSTADTRYACTYCDEADGPYCAFHDI